MDGWMVVDSQKVKENPYCLTAITASGFEVVAVVYTLLTSNIIEDMV